MAEKSAQNLVDEIAASKNNNLSRLIYALGIGFVGNGPHSCSPTSSIDAGVADASASQLMEVGEVGPKVAESIVEFFSESANREVIARLRDAGVDPRQERQAPRSCFLQDKSFVFTGSLARHSREECAELCASA